MILLIHEVYGVTKNLLLLKAFLENNGFAVACPSLYPDGYVGASEQESYTRFFTEIGFDAATKAIQTIIEENQNQTITVVGFSVGATIAWTLSENPAIHKIIGIYGSRIRHCLDVEPVVQTDLLFVEESSFNVHELMDKIAKKHHVRANLIDGTHGFYSKLPFESRIIQELNTRILKMVEHPPSL